MGDPSDEANGFDDYLAGSSTDGSAEGPTYEEVNGFQKQQWSGGLRALSDLCSKCLDVIDE